MAAGAAIPALAADLEIRYAALERMIAAEMFTPEGRLYVKGNARAKCQFAYLESPMLSSQDAAAAAPRLRINARFSGRSALDLFGKCVGLGDSFDLTLTSLPVVKDGTIALADVKVSTVKDSYYIRKVRAALEQSFQKDFRIQVKDQAPRFLEPAASAKYTPQLTGFNLQSVRVGPEALVLMVDFRLVIK